MRIGIIGGTGHMGRGLALRWAKNHDVMLGSRSSDKAPKTAKELTKVARGFYQNRMQGSIKGALNSTAIKESEVVVVALPDAATCPCISEFRECFNPKQIVVSTVVPMKKRDKFYVYTPISVEGAAKDEGESAAELIQELVKPTPVVSTLHTVPAAYLNDLDAVLNIDVFIASDNDSASNKVAKLICEIPNFRPLKAGPLQNSRLIEAITPLLLNAAILNNLKAPSIRVIPWIPTSYETCEHITS
ncbi:MAG TPA: NADPH-dependent F420 reductase [Candidatus Bathyarchaeota archaeon]|nr:NADPH-dependent F420 reductase [Candidatus Bathyarchaeota archaeon]